MQHSEKAVARVTAVIVTYQSELTLEATLARVRECHDAGLLDCVVVDNASRDGTVAILNRHSDWLKVILSNDNNGFGYGCNQGLREVDSEYVLFLNPDASIDPQCLRDMTVFMDQHGQVGACGPATIVGDPTKGTFYQACGRRTLPADLIRSTTALLAPTDLNYPIVPGSEPFRTGWVCGSVLMLRTELMKRLGGFDPRFFLYWEEVDVCKRVEDSGSEVWAVPTAVASHVGGVSSNQDENRIEGCIAKHYFQSRRYYLIKHHGWLAATLTELGEFCILGLKACMDLLRGRRTHRLRFRLQAPLFSMPPKRTS
jgi:N-acetylglucosaminyl-diphospho-decaprenol L-rhamnosyltransferase